MHKLKSCVGWFQASRCVCRCRLQGLVPAAKQPAPTLQVSNVSGQESETKTPKHIHFLLPSQPVTMRLIAGLTAAALSGLAVGASQQRADVYILSSSNQQSSSDNNTPSIPKEIVRHILLQRTSRQRYGGDLRDIPESIDTETIVSHLARFGKTPEPLFRQYDDDNKPEASQLVVILEGVTPQQNDQIKEALHQKPAFTVSDPPSSSANKNLMALFQHLGVASPSHQCDIDKAINPFDDNCWTGSASVVKYDLQKSPSTLSTLVTSLPRITSFVSASDLDLTLLVLPESSRNSELSTWSTRAHHRRRNFAGPEAVITDFDTNTQAHSTVVPKLVSSSNKKPVKKIQACYQTLAACTNATDSCSGHGKCVNKYGKDDEEGISSCFSCRCMSTVVSRGDEVKGKGKKTIHWGGNTCQKEDISIQFWLLAGFTIVIVGAVTFAISLLFNVGQEELPGVIGAGVSRGSK
ncbi:hypothetical protein QBC38DRAFT_465212 [Podospora fimiseda]|uniref:Vacuolar sorting protein Vps3844 C-terminal domain-containing protein n=1 Tax=Podospora fimiseda TaxID=252190 RepID=A0AAN7BXZ9_9PEZI|nr:hypothetical protein QBC38DRAFT_465212 [Podospora fimiseda]